MQREYPQPWNRSQGLVKNKWNRFHAFMVAFFGNVCNTVFSYFFHLFFISLFLTKIVFYNCAFVTSQKQPSRMPFRTAHDGCFFIYNMMILNPVSGIRDIVLDEDTVIVFKTRLRVLNVFSLRINGRLLPVQTWASGEACADSAYGDGRSGPSFPRPRTHRSGHNCPAFCR